MTIRVRQITKIVFFLPLSLFMRRAFFHSIGNALSTEKRRALGLMGLTPYGMDNLEIQKRRAMKQLRSTDNMLAKYNFMAQLRSRNVRLFYKLVIDDLEVSCIDTRLFES